MYYKNQTICVKCCVKGIIVYYRSKNSICSYCCGIGLSPISLSEFYSYIEDLNE